MKSIENIDAPDFVSELLEKKEDNPKDVPPSVSDKPPLLFSKRLLVAILVFLCFVNFQVLRNNMNLAVVEMTSIKSIIKGNATILQPAEFNWDSATIGLITSIINYGGLLPFVNGFLVNKLGPSTSCGISMLMAGVTTILHPVVLCQSFYAFLAWRFLTGIFEAVFYACTSAIFLRWFPVKERSTLVAFSFNGTNVGVAIVYPFCGYLAYKWGWSMVFYVTGAESVVIAAVFLILVKNYPTQDEKISKEELAYILQDNPIPSSKKEKTNNGIINAIEVFKPILTSTPLWSFFVLIFTYMWIATVITACLPLYVKDLTGKNSDEIGYISSIPNTVYIFMFPVTGALLDYWKNHSNTTTTRIHKIMISVAFITGVIFFIAVTFVSDIKIALVFFVLIQILMSFVPLILAIMAISLAPNHVSHVASMNTNFFCLGAIFAQTVIGFMTINHTLQEWNNCFLLTAAVAMIGNVIIAIFGSSDAQPWSLS